jgi:hypothetical protein
LRNTLNAMTEPADSHGVDESTATCESCGASTTADDLLPVHRVYVTPEAWDTEEKVDVVDEVERWCFPCRSLYPHQEIEAR